MASADQYQRQPLDLANATVPRGQVYIIPERCKGCDFCIQFCPEHVLAFSENINAKGYHYPTVVSGKETGCVHCGFCDLVCPEMAIFTKDVSNSG